MTKPKKLTATQKSEFCGHMRAGMRRGAAAETMGYERGFLLDEIAEDPDFEADVLEAEGHATEHVEEALYQAAVSGSVAAAKLWLDLRTPRSSPMLPAVQEGPQLDPVAQLNALMAGSD
jgi:hypothetical protein